jgi:DNA-binding XRE family transcriptional regulator
MKTEIRGKPTAGARPRSRVIDGKRMVMLEETEYQRLKQKADEWEPPLPEPNADGNYPALEYMLASMARDIIRHRRRLGLSQAELARRAGIRLETLNRIEKATHSSSVATIDKIDRALREEEATRKRRNGK